MVTDPLPSTPSLMRLIFIIFLNIFWLLNLVQRSPSFSNIKFSFFCPSLFFLILNFLQIISNYGLSNCFELVEFCTLWDLYDFLLNLFTFFAIGWAMSYYFVSFIKNCLAHFTSILKAYCLFTSMKIILPAATLASTVILSCLLSGSAIFLILMDALMDYFVVSF